MMLSRALQLILSFERQTGRKCSPPLWQVAACKASFSTQDTADLQSSREEGVLLRRMGLELLCALLLLFLGLPGSALASEKSGNDGGSSDSATVSILVCLLLLLLLLLFLAWRRLSQESEGRYHPRTLLRGLLLRWQEFRGEVPTQELSQEYEHERQRDEELGEPQQDDDTEEEEKEEQSLQLQQKAEEEEEKEERFSENADSEPPEKAVLLEPSEKDGASRATESSAEALLSDLHSFSGTAAWEDSGKHLHVTAL